MSSILIGGYNFVQLYDLELTTDSLCSVTQYPHLANYDLNLTIQGHPRLKFINGKASSHINSYLLFNSNFMANEHHFEGKAVCKYPDLKMTFKSHSRTKVMRGNKSSHMISIFCE